MDKADGITETEIRLTLSRILESAEFARSNRSSDFLRYVVEETLAGRKDRLKSFSIACDVFDRGEDFDPRVSTVVRVEAKRLRDHLAAYYASDDCDASICIEIPKGGYAPEFSRFERKTGERETGPGLLESIRNTRAAGSRSRRKLAVALLAILVTVTVLGLYRGAPFPTRQDAVDDTQPTEGRDFLVVLPMDTISTAELEQQLAAGMVEAIITDLAKLSELSVMAHASLLSLEKSVIDLDSLRRDFGVTHALRGSLESRGNQIRINMQLVDIRNGATVWADRFDGAAEDLYQLQDRVAEKVIAAMEIRISDQERASLSRRRTENVQSLALYRQGLVMILPPNNMELVISARHVFQRVIDIDPGFGGGYAGKSFSHSVTALFFSTSSPEQELQQAVELALKAIETDPDFGMGYVTLALAYTLLGRHTEALANARHAVSVQPGDAFTQFIYGICLMLSGQGGAAIERLNEALRLDPAEPRTPYRNLLGVAHLTLGEYAEAEQRFIENAEVGGPSGPHMDVFRAIVQAKLGETALARSTVHDLLKRAPDFPVEKWLNLWVLDTNARAESIELLHNHGLPRG